MLLKKPDPGISVKEFYIRSFSWGLILNMVGAIFALCAMLTGHKPERFGNCINFSFGKSWGGLSTGIFIFTCRDATKALKAHEHGHSIQNCFYGPLMPFIVNLPSSARYWYRRIIHFLLPEKQLKPYDSIWFEEEASRLGREYMNSKDNKPVKKQGYSSVK